MPVHIHVRRPTIHVTEGEMAITLLIAGMSLAIWGVWGINFEASSRMQFTAYTMLALLGMVLLGIGIVVY